MRWLAGLFLLAGCSTFQPPPEPPPTGMALICAARERVIANLSRKFGEHVTHFGLGESYGARGVIELTESSDGSFTIIMTLPDGDTCFLITGGNWQSIMETGEGT